MPLQVVLNIVTLVMCIITLAVATTALLPQIKAGLVLVRDLLLWTMLAGFLGFVGLYGWVRFIEIRSEGATTKGELLESSNATSDLFKGVQSLSPPQVTTRKTSSEKVAPAAKTDGTPGLHNRPTTRRQNESAPAFRANRSYGADPRTKRARIENPKFDRRSKVSQPTTKATSTRTVPLAIDSN